MLNSLKGNIKIPGISLYSLLLKNAEINKSQPLTIFYDKYITYNKFLSYINSMAFKLKNNLNISKDDIVLIMVDNSPEFIISIFSIIKINAVALIIDSTITENKLNDIISKYKIKLFITCKGYYNKFNYNNIKYIISDINDFLTLGKAIKNNIHNHIKIKYNKDVLKFYDFIYTDNNIEYEVSIEKPRILFIKNEKILAFTEKNLISSAIILNYWFPKVDKRPYFFSNLSMSDPVGLVYSLLLPITFSGTIVIDSLKYLNKNNPDFIIGDSALYNFIIVKRVDLGNINYLISPYYDNKIFNDIKKCYGKELITGFSMGEIITSHLNPFYDIRGNSIGMPLSNVNYKFDDGEMLIKSDQIPSYLLCDNYIKNDEWFNTHKKMIIKDDYFYPA